MKPKLLLSRNAQLALCSAISARLAVRAVLDRRMGARVVGRIAPATVIHGLATATFKSVRWSATG
jgi:hypothetical protein